MGNNNKYFHVVKFGKLWNSALQTVHEIRTESIRLCIYSILFDCVCWALLLPWLILCCGFSTNCPVLGVQFCFNI